MKAVEHWTGDHSADRGTGRRWGTDAWERRRQGQAAVGPVGVVVADVLPEDALQVPLVQDEHVIQALVAEGADDPFSDGVGAGCPERRQDGVDPQPPRPGDEVATVHGVAVPDEVFERPAPGG